MERECATVHPVIRERGLVMMMIMMNLSIIIIIYWSVTYGIFALPAPPTAGSQ
jgi:hypothetical protein